jgi:hypothetical protein
VRSTLFEYYLIAIELVCIVRLVIPIVSTST